MALMLIKTKTINVNDMHYVTITKTPQWQTWLEFVQQAAIFHIFETCLILQGYSLIWQPSRTPGACIIKLITAMIYSFRNKLECFSLASLSSIV
jgi:hypothetical protein